MNINKYKFLLVIVLLFLFCFNSSLLNKVYGLANQTEVKGAQGKNCLKGSGAITQTTDNINNKVDFANTNPVLTGNGFGNADAVYVALCTPGSKGSACSTGDGTLDKEVFGSDNSFMNGHQELYPRPNMFSYEIEGNKLKPTNGSISTKANMTNIAPENSYSFYGFYPLPPPPPSLETGGAGGDQQGTIPFDKVDTNCQSVLWDPFGRIFDSQSLEPIPGITIKALTSITPSEKLAQIYGNPQTTHQDGAFNFLVEPGTYYLRIENLPLKYSFTETPNMNKNYVKAFSKRDNTNSLYKPDEPIVEVANKPEHRDIPLDPGKNPPGHFPVVNIVSNGFDQMSFGDSTQYGGKISHPLSIVALVGKNSGKEITRTTSDKFGFWGIEIKNRLIPQDEPLLIKLIKVDLTTMKADEKNARITNDMIFYPIARQIQGYVYENNTAVPYAGVDVVTENNNKTFFHASADSKGFISIPSSSLPHFSYNLVVKAPGSNKTMPITPDVFVDENKTYLEKNNINLMIPEGEKNKSSSTLQGKKKVNTQINSSLNKSNITDNTRLTPENQKNNKYVFIILFVIFLLITLSVGIVIYLKRQKKIPY